MSSARQMDALTNNAEPRMGQAWHYAASDSVAKTSETR
jgi:hypothetical protein